MKAAANGALNLSVLDGWWAEGYQPGLGWAIGVGEEYESHDYQDEIESQALYHLLEKTILPLFHERGRDNLPREWIAMMKRSIETLAARFNSHRMVQDYVHQFYIPLALQWNQIKSNSFQGGRELAIWAERLRKNWSDVRILEIRTDNLRNIDLGTALHVEVTVRLGSLSSQDLSVETYFGPVDSKADFLDRSTLPLRPLKREGDVTVFQGDIPCEAAGRFGFRVRVLPDHPLMSNPHCLGLILWG
jgi:starch phosphorylase